MILTDIATYSAHIRRATQSFERLTLPRFDSLPGRVVLCAKYAGEPGTWSVWSVSKGRTWFAPYIGALHGYLWPALPAVHLDYASERRIDWHFSSRQLPLHEGWIVSDHVHLPYIRPRIAPHLFCVASAAGPHLRRIWCLDMTDPALIGVDPSSIEEGKPTRAMRNTDKLVNLYHNQPPVALSIVAKVVRDQIRRAE